MWALIGATLVIAIVSSTREGRAEARGKLAKYEPYIWAVNLTLIGILVFPW